MLTLPIRCSIIIAIAALVGTSFIELGKFLNARPGEILAAPNIVRVPAPKPKQEPTTPATEKQGPPFNLFIPLVVAGVLLFGWQAIDFRKSWKRAKADKLPTNIGSRKRSKPLGLRR